MPQLAALSGPDAAEVDRVNSIKDVGGLVV